jgi:hypothetical protein
MPSGGDFIDPCNFRGNMNIEINKSFAPTLLDMGYAGKGAVIPPRVGDTNYWLAKIMLNKEQGIICFPKEGTFAIGFLKEKHWNKNLAYTAPTDEIFAVIKRNKERLSDTICKEAIQKLQTLLTSLLSKHKKK